MSKRLPEGERRRRATQATRDRFHGARFDWATGMHCVALAHAHLRNMGYRTPKRLPKLPKIRSAEQARAAMEARGWASVTAMLDSVIERIAPAMMRTGDLAVVAGDQGFESVVIYLGPRKVLGWTPGDLGGVVVIYDTGLDVFEGKAWRV